MRALPIVCCSAPWRERLTRDGYASDGRYFGTGEPLWGCDPDDRTAYAYVRAGSMSEAKQAIRADVQAKSYDGKRRAVFPGEVLMQWHGGSSYGLEDPECYEVFPSIAAAVTAFRARIDGWEGGVVFPCVDNEPPDNGGPSARLWFYDGEHPGEYPDRMIECGPRGGVRVTRC